MGNSLAPRSEGKTGSNGRGRSVVRANRRTEHSSPLMAVRRPGGAEASTRAELGRRGLGRDRSQDRPLDPDDEEQDSDSHALVTRGVGGP